MRGRWVGAVAGGGAKPMWGQVFLFFFKKGGLTSCHLRWLMGGEEEKCGVTVVRQVILGVHIISARGGGVLSWPFVTLQRVNFPDRLFFSCTPFNVMTAGMLLKPQDTWANIVKLLHIMKPLGQCCSTTVLRHTSVPWDNIRCAVKNYPISPTWSKKKKHSIVELPHCNVSLFASLIYSEDISFACI